MSLCHAEEHHAGMGFFCCVVASAFALSFIFTLSLALSLSLSFLVFVLGEKLCMRAEVNISVQ